MSQASRFDSAGFAWFDDPSLEDGMSGWFSVCGDPARRFSRHSDLPSDCLFVTNLDWESTRKQNLNMHNLRHATFLATDVQGLCADLGCLPDVVGLPETVSVLGDAIDASCALARQLYGQEVLALNSLTAGIQTVISTKKPDASMPQFQIALENAWQRLTVCERPTYTPFSPYSKRHTLRMNRAVHANRVLTQGVPAGIPERATNVKVSAQELIDRGQPVLARVSVRDMHPDAAPVFVFGSGKTARRGRNIPSRQWVTYHELVVMNQLAIVDVMPDEMYLWPEWQTVQTSHKLPQLLNESVVAASYSGQLIAEAHLGAVLSPLQNSGMTQSVRKIYTPACVFATAIDRMFTFRIAMAVALRRLVPTFYMSGRVYVQTRSEEEENDLVVFARESGLAFPVATDGDVQGGN